MDKFTSASNKKWAITIDDRPLDLSYFSVGEAKNYAAKAKEFEDKDGDSFEYMSQCLEKKGLPVEMQEKLSSDDLTYIVEKLMSGGKKK